MKKIGLIWVALCLSFQIKAEVTLEAINSRPAITEVKISPGGEYLAVKVFEKGRHQIKFLDRKTFAPLGWIDVRMSGGTSEVGNFWWANNERIVGQILQARDGAEKPQNYGELFAANFDGKKRKVLFGFRSGDKHVGTHRNTAKSDRAWAGVIDLYRENPKKIIISRKKSTQSANQIPVAEYLNIYNGVESKSPIARAVKPFARFITDDNSEVRMIVNSGADSERIVQVKVQGAEDWTTLDNSKHGPDFNPVSELTASNQFFAVDSYGTDKIGLYKYTLPAFTSKKIYSNKTVDATRVLRSLDKHTVFGMTVEDGYPHYLLMKSAHPEAKIFRSLLGAFPGERINILSYTDDGKEWIIHTQTDRDPGNFYLFNQENQEVALLFKSKPGLNPDDLSPMEPITFESFDGLPIHGYFTKGIVSKKHKAPPPMVVLVHGGPRARDYWQFNSLVHSYAVSGISVLQINYRGSTGYGKEFMHKGDLQWGDAVQKDIAAGTRWAIEQGMADKQKVCIAGGSFGAYSAIQSVALTPDLYKCAVANAGIYDLELLYKTGDIKYSYGGRNYLEEAVGKDEAQLRAYSPAYNVASITAPLLLAHGKRDKRAPYKHARVLMKALDEHHIDYETYIKGREAHGFYDTDNQIEYLNRAIAFVKQHIGD